MYGSRKNSQVSGGKQENERPEGKGREMCKHTEQDFRRLFLKHSLLHVLFTGNNRVDGNKNSLVSEAEAGQ